MCTLRTFSNVTFSIFHRLQLNETLHDEVNREREWIMVMDNDVMFPNFRHPVESFIANYSDSCDLFVEGDERILGQKDYVNALNTVRWS
jgi:hypothetical protein